MKDPRNRALALDRGREAFKNRAWSAAFTQLLEADREASLTPEDLQQLAMAAHLSGREAGVSDVLARAHHGFLERGDKRRAAQCAFWLGFIALDQGESAQGSGWLARSRRLLESESDCVERGYLLLPAARIAMHAGDGDAAYRSFVEAGSIADRFGDRDLSTLALQGQGRALIRQGDMTRGTTLLDEAMIAVTSGEVSPVIAGAVYCSVIESCQDTLDMRRALEWTTALGQWCDAQPELVPYRGHCLLQRAEILQLRGEWPAAMDEARRARRRLSEPVPKPSVGAALYRIAELHRLRGEFVDAEEAYRQASRWDPEPKPGLALLRLFQGRAEAAASAIRLVADAAREPVRRARVLDPYVEIMLAAGDLPSARAAADELAATADRHGALLLRASSGRAAGAVLLAEGRPRDALMSLRRSYDDWHELDAPYEAARTRVLLALASRGDEDFAREEMTAAQEVFRRLGAACDLARLEAIAAGREPVASGPLTGREIEVLRLVASGMTNREIAGKLFISEKTVARHVSNIFTKLELSSRAAATAYAFRHGLA